MTDEMPDTIYVGDGVTEGGIFTTKTVEPTDWMYVRADLGITTEGERQPTEEDAKPCSKCPALIVWRHTNARNRPIPLNWPPEKRAIIGKNKRVYIVDAFTPHWATCPASGQFRG